MRGALLAAIGTAALAAATMATAQDAAQAPAQMPAERPVQGPPAPAGTASVPPDVAGPVQTLRDALVRTYHTNPTLAAQRAQLRGTDEGVDIAASAGRPQVSASGGINRDIFSHNIVGENGRSLNAGVDVSLPLYSGGRVRNSVNAANQRVQAGRADLRATEGDVFTDAVTAYMDVIRDRSIVELNQNNVHVLETNLEATRDRFEVGDLTRTDVAQSEARLALARSQLLAAQSQLQASEENYRRVIGETPGDLQPPPTLPTLPGTPDQATDVALANNADLASIASQARAAGFDVAVARGARLPTISAVNSTNYFNALGRADEAAGVPNGTLPNSTATSTIGLQLTLPLYQGGLAAARVRQAQDTRSQLLEQAIGVERGVVSATRSAFAAYRAAQDAIASNEVAVAANELALEGTRAEQTVGTRNVLDVLNAEQELLNSQVALVTARHDAYVAGFQLLNVMGQAEAEDLDLDGGALYDPIANYDRHAHDWSDWDDGPRPQVTSTRTVPEDANSPVTQLPR
jgi:outer membrane protein